MLFDNYNKVIYNKAMNKKIMDKRLEALALMQRRRILEKRAEKNEHSIKK